ncbi:alternate-type signal peptide domain-containing protein [Protaetiibacter larvae]|nr:alternate-type signal peptide domain-containing protein [Protaetiibacter larvae]
MNKLTKAGIATAAGIALLMGGAGTLAYWNESATVAAGTVQTGHLELTAGSAGWADSISHIVPGDTATYTAAYTLSALGDNIDVDLSATLPAASGIDLSVSYSYTIDGTAHASGDVVSLDEGDYAVVVTVVVAFASSSTTHEDETVNLGDVVITATQV